MREHDFDVAFTFAGEDRKFVEEVAQLVKDAGFKVFYDEDQKHESWGQDLTEYFPDVYERRARFAVMFISKDYALKPWTRLERRSVLVRALNDNKEYLLPVRLDSTKLPGVREAIGYLDGPRETPAGVARAIALKLGSPASNDVLLFNGRVPRTTEEVGVMLGERPSAWEYLLFSYHLYTKMELLADRYADFRLGFATPGEHIKDEEIAELMQTRLASLRFLGGMFQTLLDGRAQYESMGHDGEDGDPDLIEGLAARIVTLYSELLAWEARLRSTSTQSDEGAEVIKAIAAYAVQPIESLRQFVVEYRTFADAVTARLAAGENVTMEIPITWEIPAAITERADASLEAFERYIIRTSP